MECENPLVGIISVSSHWLPKLQFGLGLIQHLSAAEQGGLKLNDSPAASQEMVVYWKHGGGGRGLPIGNWLFRKTQVLI